MNQNTALILEGGGSRGMFTAGILEIFLKKQLFFKSVYGVSAGAYNGASYVSRQEGRNLAINDFIGDKRYRSFKSLLKTGSLFSWDFIFDELAENLVPYDYEALQNSSSKFYVGISNCGNAEAEFHPVNQKSKAEIKSILIASGSLPLISPLVKFKNNLYLDGGLADSIPFEQALKDGADKVVVILTRPRGYMKAPLKQKSLFKSIYKKHPKVYKMLLSRADQYNDSLRKLNQLEQEGKAFVIYPEQELAVRRIESNPNKTALVYSNAMLYAEELMPKLQEWFDS